VEARALQGQGRLVGAGIHQPDVLAIEDAPLQIREGQHADRAVASRAASFTARNRRVSASKIHMGCEGPQASQVRRRVLAAPIEPSARATASSGVEARMMGTRRPPGGTRRQVPSPTNGTPSFRARAISDSVP
jgi:hypothetical protein